MKIEENDLLQNIVYLFLLLAVSVVVALMDTIVFNTAVQRRNKQIGFENILELFSKVSCDGFQFHNGYIGLI